MRCSKVSHAQCNLTHNQPLITVESKSLCQSCHRPIGREIARSHRLSVPNFISDECESYSTASTESGTIFYDGMTGSIPSLNSRNLLMPRISDAVQMPSRQQTSRKPSLRSPDDSIETRLDSGMSSADSGEIEAPTVSTDSDQNDKPSAKGHLQSLLKSFGKTFDQSRSESHLDEVAQNTTTGPPVANSTPNMTESDSPNGEDNFSFFVINRTQSKLLLFKRNYWKKSVT